MGLAVPPTHVVNEGPPRREKYSEGWAWVRVRGAFVPDLIEARAGERLRLVFRREETASCSERVVMPSLGKSVTLPPFEDVAVDLGPLPSGEHEFSCGLGVLQGHILVRGRTANESVVSTEPKTALVPDGGARRPPHSVSDKSRGGS